MGMWVFTQTAVAGWMKMGGAESPGPEEALEELDMVELVGAADDMATRGVALRGQRDGAGAGVDAREGRSRRGASGGALRIRVIGGAASRVDAQGGIPARVRGEAAARERTLAPRAEAK